MRSLGSFCGPKHDPPEAGYVYPCVPPPPMPPRVSGRAVAGAVDLAKPAPEVSDARDVARLAVKLAAGKSMVTGGQFVFGVPERPEGETHGFACEKHVRKAIHELHKEGRTPTESKGDIATKRIKPT